MSVRSVLTIAGSDSSGGAGIQADLKTFAANGCYGTSAMTALTAQNTTGVQEVHAVPPGFVEKQIQSILVDIETHAIKTGMLYDAENVRAAVKALSGHYDRASMPPLVCDPVCVSTSGHSLLHPDAIQALADDLFPLSKIITPNKSEAELLLAHCGMALKITSLDDMIIAAKNLLRFGSQAVLLKGGHVVASMGDIFDVDPKSDIEVVSHGLPLENMEILRVGETENLWPRLVVDVLCESGTEPRAVKTTLFIRPFIHSSSTHGTGCTLSAAIASRLACKDERLPLPQILLPRVRVLLVAKSNTFDSIGRATQTIINVLKEIATHKSFCKSYGITEDMLKRTPEVAATSAYGAYLIDIGLQGDTTKLLMALLACLLGYGEVGLWLKKEAARPASWVVLEGNPYKPWMDDYSGEGYQGAVKMGLELIEACAAADPPSKARYKEWNEVWQRCTRLEKGFWDAAMAAA
ncbi:hypothetical protein H0H81_010329 [Sphagnurus paluster]|uniref:Phosphomethylpyrimidine kinase n=1 Tax=Sphagnurus paluster TaxID=117069 RepID=A0A9P7GQ62_9AGAR|nr:hypothetical protein H0H81_010329 [Sphagnurus paluster]